MRVKKRRHVDPGISNPRVLKRNGPRVGLSRKSSRNRSETTHHTINTVRYVPTDEALDVWYLTPPHGVKNPERVTADQIDGEIVE